MKLCYTKNIIALSFCGAVTKRRLYKNMTEENKMADIPHEGENPFNPESGNENPESSPDEINESEETPPADGEEKNPQDPDKDLPFHEHPRWKAREEEWDKRFNDQETRHQDDLKKIREEFGTARKENAEQTNIPSWFGGTQEQWDAYRTDRDTELKSAEDRAYERLTKEKSVETKAVEEATTYLQSEVAFIGSDKTINPTGAKVDPNKLLKIVMDNDLVDSKGRWNYRAGWRLLQREASGTAPSGDRKNIAGATTSESKGESKPAPFKTSADFKKAKPW